LNKLLTRYGTLQARQIVFKLLNLRMQDHQTVPLICFSFIHMIKSWSWKRDRFLVIVGALWWVVDAAVLGIIK